MAVGSPLGRSTHVFKAYCIETGKLVLLKDTWRVVSASQIPKHIIYEKLKKQGYEDAGFVNGKTHFFAIEVIAALLTEMVTAVRDAIIAHGDTYDKAKILHRDISSGNILITETGGGLLIDWDLCKKLQDIYEGQGHIERTGTWQFMAARLLVIPTDGEGAVIPDRADDLESFLSSIWF
ncbi:hypothetical protein BU17DRAFT_96331 [Hysterangium stoloniferum]|nr:hypothetical protein BU17DRAFT_96331 [Hysterangium stoloniferum]